MKLFKLYYLKVSIILLFGGVGYTYYYFIGCNSSG